ncbi:hypothetical protein C2H98_15985 [Niallia circulans]|nr:hypothetical protein C2H98_15985 [Niallia circulans]
MKKIKSRRSIVPKSIELLFNNDQLEIVKTLCLLYAFYLKSKKKFYKVSDITFYYSLVNFNLVKLFKESNIEYGIDGKMTPNLYYRYQTKVSKIILELSNLDYIEIKGDITYKTSDIGVRLTTKGLDFIMLFDKEFFVKLIDSYITVINQIDNTSVNKKIISGGIS